MNMVIRSALSGAILVLSAQVAAAACQLSGKCEDAAAVETARTRIAADCDCGGTGGRKAYKKCVKDGIKTAIKDGTLPKPCKKAVKGCESSSTCGQSTAVVCCQVNGHGKVKARIVKDADSCEGGDVCNGAQYTADACTSAGSCLSRPFKAVQQVFSQSCALPTCHSTLAREGDLALDSEQVSYQNLVDRPAIHPQASGLMRVKSGDPENSLLIRKLRGLGPGDRMPVGGQLPEDVIEIIEAWITRGAHGTDEECPAVFENNPGDTQTAAHGTYRRTICDDAPIDGGDFVWQPEPPLPVPDPSEGLQLHAPRVEGITDVKPGTEWELCYAFRPDWDAISAKVGVPAAELTIKEQTYRMHQGSHHLLVYGYFGKFPEQWALGRYFPCLAASCTADNPDDCPPDAGGNLIPIGGTQVAGTRYEVKYPEGVGIPPNLLSDLLGNPPGVIIANLHYQNPFLPAQDLYGEAWLNFMFHKPGEYQVLLDGVFAINFADLKVEPFESRTISRIWQPRSLIFRRNVDAAVFQLFGHMHARGTLFQIDVVKGAKCQQDGVETGRVCGRDEDCGEGQTCVKGPNAEDTTIYHSTEWDNQPVVDYPAPYLIVNEDEGLRWTCTHVNGVEGDPAHPPKVCHAKCRSCGWDPATRTCKFWRFEPTLDKVGDPLPAGQQGVLCADQKLYDEEIVTDCTGNPGACADPNQCVQTFRLYQVGDPMPLVFGELASDDMCNMFGYMVWKENLCTLGTPAPGQVCEQ